MVVDFLDHDFRDFRAFVSEDFNAAENFIFSFLGQFVVVSKHLVKFFLTLLNG